MQQSAVLHIKPERAVSGTLPYPHHHQLKTFHYKERQRVITTHWPDYFPPSHGDLLHPKSVPSGESITNVDLPSYT